MGFFSHNLAIQFLGLEKKMLLTISLLLVGVIWTVEGGVCSAGSECGPGQCCMMVVPMKGKRSALSTTCQRMGTDGMKCYVDAKATADSKYTNQCPCAPGYTCASTGIREIPQGLIGVCKKTQVRHHRPCYTGAECDDSECCQSVISPRGKRDSQPGTCQPMGTKGSKCYVMYKSGKTDILYYGCPCVSHFDCVFNGNIAMPLGKMGYCMNTRVTH